MKRKEVVASLVNITLISLNLLWLLLLLLVISNTSQLGSRLKTKTESLLYKLHYVALWEM